LSADTKPNAAVPEDVGGVVESLRNATKNWCHFYPGGASAVCLHASNLLEQQAQEIAHLTEIMKRFGIEEITPGRYRRQTLEY
jgi:hypothetical protein